MTTITARVLQSAQSKLAPYFIRDAKVKGFAAKVNPSGSIKLIVEVRYEGMTRLRDASCLSWVALKVRHHNKFES
ncbi:hypothetical protein [Desulforhopalus sp. IMCC35007]|uniref:hypothetical protein n=1 Tax=Desulforhopalus sp. IMCC35007 TaxID=2569543 RepID=UPI0010ADFE7A|nr:hypothetical protein [Desulforhopalus sp. IMCC35007]TKB11800.1 hypothetical protein FCL48_03120 [Desulforhopalus sp. IMCC35007]